MSKDLSTPDRLLPRSHEAEQAVLGSLLRDNSVFADVAEVLRGKECFYEDAHQKVYTCIAGRLDAAKPTDVVTLAEDLLQRKTLPGTTWADDIGGLSYLAELWNATPTAGNAIHYAHIVRDRWLVRSLIHAATEILRDAYDQAQAPLDLLGTAERKILDIAGAGAQTETKHVSVWVQQATERIQTRIENQQNGGNGITGLASGLADLDALTSGLQPSELIVLAARPSQGKTLLGSIYAMHVAVRLGEPVLFVSAEQPPAELTERLLVNLSPVHGTRLRQGRPTPDELDKLADGVSRLRESPLFIADAPGFTLSRIKSLARRYKAKENIALLVIDYLQIINPDDTRISREQQVASISKGLKWLARELAIPILLLAQLNREVESRPSGRPKLSDLRESGSLEQDGDTVLLLWPHPDENPSAPLPLLSVIVAKQRNGPTGDAVVVLRKEYLSFENFAPDAFAGQ